MFRHATFLKTAPASLKNGEKKNDDVKRSNTKVWSEINCSYFPIEDPILHCIFGNEFLKRVVGWARALKWPNNPVGQISMLELYVDFTIFTRSLTPVPLE